MERIIWGTIVEQSLAPFILNTPNINHRLEEDQIISGWWSGTFFIFPYIYIYWECHHPNWRNPWFFRGVGQPPTRYIWDHGEVLFCWTGCGILHWIPMESHYQWEFQDPTDGGTVPYFRPYFVGIFTYIGLKQRPYTMVGTSNQSDPGMAIDIFPWSTTVSTDGRDTTGSAVPVEEVTGFTIVIGRYPNKHGGSWSTMVYIHKNHLWPA